MSSDGQSIPFGHNWIHKIEEGLNKAQIMFVFVTPISLNSAWIYFEAGFAYSKNVEVIPVGVGVNIAQLKAPLNLLQGFDITSADSLNNFITIINRKFDLNFPESFSDVDYQAVYNSDAYLPTNFDFNEIFKSASYTKYSQYSGKNEGEIIRYNIDEFFDGILNYLEEKHIQYSYGTEDFYHKKHIFVGGIQFLLQGEEKQSNDGRADQSHKITVKLSMQNFNKSFDMLREIESSVGRFNDNMFLHFEFNPSCDCLHDSAAISSIIFDNDTIFQYNKDEVENYKYKNKIDFWLRNKNAWRPSDPPLYVLGISFATTEVTADDITELVRNLLKCGLIFKTNLDGK